MSSRGLLCVCQQTLQSAAADVPEKPIGGQINRSREDVMSKGMDQKKQAKKEPQKSLKEKRAAKQEKKSK